MEDKGFMNNKLITSFVIAVVVMGVVGTMVYTTSSVNYERTKLQRQRNNELLNIMHSTAENLIATDLIFIEGAVSAIYRARTESFVLAEISSVLTQTEIDGRLAYIERELWNAINLLLQTNTLTIADHFDSSQTTLIIGSIIIEKEDFDNYDDMYQIITISQFLDDLVFNIPVSIENYLATSSGLIAFPIVDSNILADLLDEILLRQLKIVNELDNELDEQMVKSKLWFRFLIVSILGSISLVAILFVRNQNVDNSFISVVDSVSLGIVTLVGIFFVLATVG